MLKQHNVRKLLLVAPYDNEKCTLRRPDARKVHWIGSSHMISSKSKVYLIEKAK